MMRDDDIKEQWVSSYLEAYCSASLLDCFHCVFNLKNAALWTPCDHICVILQRERMVGGLLAPNEWQRVQISLNESIMSEDRT